MCIAMAARAASRFNAPSMIAPARRVSPAASRSGGRARAGVAVSIARIARNSARKGKCRKCRGYDALRRHAMIGRRSSLGSAAGPVGVSGNLTRAPTRFRHSRRGEALRTGALPVRLAWAACATHVSVRCLCGPAVRPIYPQCNPPRTLVSRVLRADGILPIAQKGIV